MELLSHSEGLRSGGSFYVHSVLWVSTVLPSSGPVSGGTRLAVIGSGFREAATMRCRMEESSGTAVARVVSDGQLECTAPAASGEGARVVEVSMNARDYTSDGVHFEYRPPAHVRALAEAGLLGLQVPVDQGGLGQGLLGLCVLTEAIARACPSSALCYGMHCVATAVIAAKATDHQREHYLKEIAAGRHVTTLALSEQGTGAHFYLPETRLDADGEDFIVEGTKQFVWTKTS